MKVTGFTIVRNAIRYDYPIVESIRSILPLVDEFVVCVGQGSDETLEVIHSIGNSKLRIIETVWDDSRRRGGQVLADQTNLAKSYCEGDWLFYLQADEVVHEDDLGHCKQAMEANLGNPQVVGLSFRYHHFRADYSIRDPLPYRKQVRIVKNMPEIQSVGDACGFSYRGKPLRGHPTGAWMYHYGYVRPPANMAAKMDYFLSLYDGRQVEPGMMLEDADYEWDLSTCEKFLGAHPAVMRERILAKDWPTPELHLTPRWRNSRYWRGLINKNTRTIQRWTGKLKQSLASKDTRKAA